MKFECNQSFPSKIFSKIVLNFSSYGQSGFQSSFSLDSNASTSIRRLIFLDGKARLLVLTVDGYLHDLELVNYNSSSNEIIRIDRMRISNEDDSVILQNIQTICLLRNHSSLFVGLSNGNIYLFNIETFSLNHDSIIPRELIEKT